MHRKYTEAGKLTLAISEQGKYTEHGNMEEINVDFYYIVYEKL